MTLAAGTSLGSYEILGSLGAGAMGEVYRARDSTLDREIAIKILPEAFARDRERLDRFQREARLLAAVRHPAIATIHGLEESSGIRFLVMELVEGETLAERIDRGLLLEETIRIFVQIAEALEAAHDKGIVHRDLKPTNVKIEPDGSVKVLDFGLAKVYGGHDAVVDSSQSPTLSKDTAFGSILGTPSYMSPEQARGRSVDPRTDIWAFGCCLFEALTGRSAFAKDSVADTIASVLRASPDWDCLPDDCPPLLGTLLRQCLQKEAHDRWHHAADLRVALKSLPQEATPRSETRPSISRGGWGIGIGVGLGVGAILGMGGSALMQPDPIAPGVMRFAIETAGDQPVAASQEYGSVAVSPDGQTLVYATRRQRGEPNRPLFVRRLRESEMTPVTGTEGGAQPFFSPDGEWIGFWQGGLWKSPVSGGRAIRLTTSSSSSRGASWSDDGWIYYHVTGEGLHRIPEGGGESQSIVRSDPSAKEKTIRYPSLLPGGDALLLVVGSSNMASYDEASIEAFDLGTRRRELLVQGGTSPRYAPTGHLVFARDGEILAAPFDRDSLELTGPPAVVTTGVLTSAAYGTADFAFSDDGTLVFVPGDPAMHQTTLLWVDRSGESDRWEIGSYNVLSVRFSPDGGRIAMWVSEGSDDTWVRDLATGSMLRLTSEWDNTGGIWTPDGRRVIYRTLHPESSGFYMRNIDGSGTEELLFEAPNLRIAEDVSVDGVLVYAAHGDLWAADLAEPSPPERLFSTEFVEDDPAFSPDGRWLAYASNETGRFEIYVRPYPGPGGRYAVSTGGGLEPRWHPSGAELCFASGDTLYSASLELGADVRVSPPEALFEVPGLVRFDVAPDGRFLVVQEDPATKPTEIHVVLNWFEDLKQRVSTN